MKNKRVKIDYCFGFKIKFYFASMKMNAAK